MDMHNVFLSYSSKDSEQTEIIYTYLNHCKGIKCWMAPHDILGGSDFDREIVAAIRACEVIVAVVSTDSLKSDHVLNEIRLGKKYRKQIIPYKLDDSELEGAFEYYLNASQIVSAKSNGLHELCTVVGSRLGIRIAAQNERQLQTNAAADGEKTESREKDKKGSHPIRDAEIIVCPHCGSHDIARKRNNPIEALLAYIRCNRETAFTIWYYVYNIVGFIFTVIYTVVNNERMTDSEKMNLLDFCVTCIGLYCMINVLRLMLRFLISGVTDDDVPRTLYTRRKLEFVTRPMKLHTFCCKECEIVFSRVLNHKTKIRFKKNESVT